MSIYNLKRKFTKKKFTIIADCSLSIGKKIHLILTIKNVKKFGETTANFSISQDAKNVPCYISFWL